MTRAIVLALGGNAVLPEGAAGTYEQQRRNAGAMAAVAANLAARGERIVLTHGNGPQVGALALQQEAATDVPAQPLFSLVAATQGQVGHLFVLSLRALLPRERSPVAAVITHVVVDPDDPAFASPSKPIGPSYPCEEAGRLARERGWAMAPTGGGRCRRVVPSPAPREIVELDVVRALVEAGTTVVTAGGGGIPVVRDAGGALRGVDAVVDKDFAAERLASSLDARLLVMVTDVEAVALDHGTPSQRFVERMTVEEASGHLAAGQFPPGSMGPKVAAAIGFVKNGGEAGVITSVAHVEAAVDGRHGTLVVAA